MALNPVRALLATTQETSPEIIVALRELLSQHHMHGAAGRATTLQAFRQLEDEIPQETLAMHIEAVILRCAQEMTLSVRAACGEMPAFTASRARHLTDLRARIIADTPAKAKSSKHAAAVSAPQKLRTAAASSKPTVRASGSAVSRRAGEPVYGAHAPFATDSSQTPSHAPPVAPPMRARVSDASSAPDADGFND